jgi:hypothetical protein
MSKKTRLEQLEQECHGRGVRLIYDDLRSEGGLCRLRGSYFLILNRRLASETRVRIIADALARVPERARDVTETRPEVSDRVPVSADRVPSAVEAASVVEGYPVPEYEEPAVGVPVAAGVPNSQS